MREQYDVVIAGAGPAGAQCARDLAARDYDVLVLETEPEDEFPRQSNKSTGGTFPSMLTSFGIPDRVVMNFTDGVVLESPNEHYVQEQAGAVLEFGKFKQFLVDDGIRRGAEYRFDARVTRPVMNGNEMVGVEYNGSEQVHGRIMVDATGPSAPLAKALRVSDLERMNQAIGIEYEFDAVNIAYDGYADLSDKMMLRLDHTYAPGGYAWIFHTGAETAKVGLCYIQNTAYQRYATADRTVDGYLERWLETDPRFTEAEEIPDRRRRGSAHIQHPGRLSAANFMAVGDTVPTIDPLWGEGIHQGMRSGRAAAITADHCLTPNPPDTSAENMTTYNDLWHRWVAPNMDSRLWMTHLLYFASNDRYDRFIRDLNRLDPDTLTKANQGSVRAVMKLVHLTDAPLLFRFLRHWYTR